MRLSLKLYKKRKDFINSVKIREYVKVKYKDTSGYIREREHSDLVHRNIAYEQIYRKNRDKYPLPFRKYVVHHKDGNKENYDVNNLEVLLPYEHEKIHGIKNVEKNPSNQLRLTYIKEMHKEYTIPSKEVDRREKTDYVEILKSKKINEPIIYSPPLIRDHIVPLRHKKRIKRLFEITFSRDTPDLLYDYAGTSIIIGFITSLIGGVLSLIFRNTFCYIILGLGLTIITGSILMWLIGISIRIIHIIGDTLVYLWEHKWPIIFSIIISIILLGLILYK